MKKYTHPQLSYTLLRHKDGSTQGIYWIYSRPLLLLEANSKKINEFLSSNSYSVYAKPEVAAPKELLSFWHIN